jgi:hypothetical protein
MAGDTQETSADQLRKVFTITMISAAFFIGAVILFVL